MNEERKKALKVILRWYFYSVAVVGWAILTYQIYIAFYASTMHGIYCMRYFKYNEQFVELIFIPLMLVFMILYVIVDIKERNKKENET